MDPAIALSCEKRGESSTVTIAYNRSAPIRFINALKALIFEKQELSPVDDEEGEETPGQFERPMSLKGQRHVFLYKCRYSQLKSIIDHCGCWGLRMASLQEKWPCLVV
ncbi:hypothetical protein AV274_1812 [Blastocystis sp. ATCC 50177/Nand II]|uniref:Uncharacterized protein n=1 Tax=Blastocystis sp. subtype 1 (strain ATCC 50177 / NandII) TaxID=478820 RepID=A0A196SKP0_BLAHN|nr:hypothetical protein AV274_1812 [Blastocystis sp. ATCC 50177/Nand II]